MATSHVIVHNRMSLLDSINKDILPKHLAVIMDGNGRWASKRFLPRIAGHKQGVDALKRIVSLCPSRGISALTVFAFSSENWNRPAEEVSGLMDILGLALSREVPKLQRDGVRIRFVGARDNLIASNEARFGGG